MKSLKRQARHRGLRSRITATVAAGLFALAAQTNSSLGGEFDFVLFVDFRHNSNPADRQYLDSIASELASRLEGRDIVRVNDVDMPDGRDQFVIQKNVLHYVRAELTYTEEHGGVVQLHVLHSAGTSAGASVVPRTTINLSGTLETDRQKLHRHLDDVLFPALDARLKGEGKELLLAFCISSGTSDEEVVQLSKFLTLLYPGILEEFPEASDFVIKGISEEGYEDLCEGHMHPFLKDTYDHVISGQLFKLTGVEVMLSWNTKAGERPKRVDFPLPLQQTEGGGVRPDVRGFAQKVIELAPPDPDQ